MKILHLEFKRFVIALENKILKNDNYAVSLLFIDNINTDAVSYVFKYATKEYVQFEIASIEFPEGNTNMIALSKEEILDICKPKGEKI